MRVIIRSYLYLNSFLRSRSVVTRTQKLRSRLHGTDICRLDSTFKERSRSNWECSSFGTASDRHSADASSIPRCGEGFSVQTLLRCPYSPMCSCMHLRLWARYRFCGPCQNSVDYRNTKTPSMHRRFGNATLSQLALPRGRQPEFSMGEIPLGQYGCKTSHTL